MQRQPEDAVDLLRVTDVTGESNGSILISDAGAGGFGTRSVPRKQDHARAGFSKLFCNRLANTH